nr:MAG TPA: hypothetical protein [Caudoviricetes sp.]
MSAPMYSSLMRPILLCRNVLAGSPLPLVRESV